MTSRRRAVALAALLGALCVLGYPEVYSRMGGRVTAIVNLLRDGTSLNDADAERQIRGYYEDLAHVERFDARLAQVYGLTPDDTEIRPGRWVRRATNDFRMKELMPSLNTISKGAAFHTNRWGMRDRDYEPEPPPGTCRMALLGPSTAVGAGVADDKIFEALLEERLNREHGGLPFGSYEILNFAQPAYSLLDQLLWIDKSRLFDWDPAIILYIAHPLELDRVFAVLNQAIQEQRAIPFPNIQQMIASAGAKAGMDETEVRVRLRPFGDRILRWAYQQIAAQCRQHHVRLVWVFLPSVPRRAGDETEPAVRDELFAAARDAGFQIVDLTGVYRHRDQKSLAQAPWDDHPNALGHALIAERLYEALRESEKTAPLGIFSPVDPAHAAAGGCR